MRKEPTHILAEILKPIIEVIQEMESKRLLAASARSDTLPDKIATINLLAASVILHIIPNIPALMPETFRSDIYVPPIKDYP